MKVLLIYNAAAANKRTKKILPEVEALFDEKGIQFELRITDYPEHAVDIVGNADFFQYDGVVAGGGDGTLFEVINGYYKNKDMGKIPIGILPIGTGNAFACDLDMDVARWHEAVEIIKMGQSRNVDVRVFHTHGQDYYFLNILGLDFWRTVFCYSLSHNNCSYVSLQTQDNRSMDQKKPEIPVQDSVHQGQI